jgi:hypothetical protein
MLTLEIHKLTSVQYSLMWSTILAFYVGDLDYIGYT